MTLPIISADQRLAENRGIKGVIFGKSGIGKTSLLWTLNASTTLFLDLEAGDLAVEGLEIDTLRPRTWKECRDFAVFIGGPNPALRDEQPYSPAHYKAVSDRFGDPAALDRYDTIFVSNYALINVIDELRRTPGVGDASLFGAADYSMRIWLRPDKLAQYSLSPSDIAAAIRTPAVAETLLNSGVEVIGSSSDELAKVLAEEADRFAKIIKTINIKAD